MACKFNKVDIADVRSNSRLRKFVATRQMIVWCYIELTFPNQRITQEELERYFSKGHPFYLNSQATWNNLMQTDKDIKNSTYDFIGSLNISKEEGVKVVYPPSNGNYFINRAEMFRNHFNQKAI